MTIDIVLALCFSLMIVIDGSFEFLSEGLRCEWLSGLYSLRQMTEVKLGRVRSNFGWVTSEV